MDDGDDGRGLAQRVEREQPRFQEGAHRAQRALRHHATGIFLADGVKEWLEVVGALDRPGCEHGTARRVKATQERRARERWRAVCAEFGSTQSQSSKRISWRKNVRTAVVQWERKAEPGGRAHAAAAARKSARSCVVTVAISCATSDRSIDARENKASALGEKRWRKKARRAPPTR